MTVTSTELYQLSARAEVNEKTARKWLNPALRHGMKPIVARRIARAASELGLVPDSPAKRAA